MRVSVNLFYFGMFFALLVATSAGGLFFRENLGDSRLFFLLYAVGQALLETSLLIFFGGVIRRFLGGFCFSLFIGATFLLLVCHFLDFLVGQLLDLSVWEVFDAFVLGESIENFLYLLDASGIPMWAWAFLFGAVALLPLLGIVLYRMTEKIASCSLRWEMLLQTFFCLPAALLFWDFSASRTIYPDAYTGFIQSLPWKFTFLQPRSVLYPIAGSFQRPLSEEEVKQKIASDTTILAKKPNIYLFVTESLRADSITPEGTPHLDQFRKQALLTDRALSNGNGTCLCWFSIFHSQFPIFWKELNGWSMGSPPLNLLKKWGYEIHLYSSAQLGYYGLEELLFGKEKKLVDVYKAFHHVPPLSAADTDTAALEQLKRDLASDESLQEGHVFIVFWDSTHFHYSWPKSWTPKFLPFTKEFAYFQAFFSPRNIDLIRNRYRNAANYIDSLFGSFLQDLPKAEEAIVIFLGDHGEEFLEKGHLFHGSHLVSEQTQIPLMVRFGSKTYPKIEGIFSQVDLFPTVLHYLSGTSPSYLAGRSIFAAKRPNYTLMSRFNGGKAPYEFCLHNGKYKLTARFSNKNQIFHSNELRIRSLRDASDRVVHEKEAEKWIHSEFGPALEQLFYPGH